jgi:hypothetical protein
MNLKEFVTQSLLQIMEGVQAAQGQVRGNALIVPPARGTGKTVADGDVEPWRHIHKVEFDVAVTASSGSEAKAGAGLVVAAIGLGAQALKSTENTAISRIRFEVPIAFPTSPDRTAPLP